MVINWLSSLSNALGSTKISMLFTNIPCCNFELFPFNQTNVRSLSRTTKLFLGFLDDLGEFNLKGKFANF